jgi:FkbM family methyltransferase
VDEVRRDEPDRRHLLSCLERQADLCRAPRPVRARQLFFRLALPRLLDLAGLARRVTARTFFDRDMRVHLPDLVGTKLYQYGFFEEGLTRALVETLPSGGVFVDIGAHVGYYTLLASLLAGPTGRVVAFEPTPRTRGELAFNTAGLGNVELVPQAAWHSSAKLRLEDFGWRQSSFNSVVAARVAGDPISQTIEVDAVAVDDWLEAAGVVPTFIKIDAESAELQVLLGLWRTIERHRPILSLEVGDYDLDGVPRSAELVRLLTTHGYSAWQYLERRFVEHRPAQFYKYDNLLFLPAGSRQWASTGGDGSAVLV